MQYTVWDKILWVLICGFWAFSTNLQNTGKSSHFSIQKLLWLRFGFLIIHKAKKPHEVVQLIFYGYLVITFEIQKISIYGQPYPMLYMEIKITTCEF